MSINKLDAHSKADCTHLISNHCYTDLSSYTFDVQTIFQISDCTLSSSLIADMLEWLLQHLGNVCSFIPIYSVGESLCCLPMYSNTIDSINIRSIYSYNLSERNIFAICCMCTRITDTTHCLLNSYYIHSTIMSPNTVNSNNPFV